ncbi:MAG TPA: Rrf2 family transcriptional regulator [Candidatus Hydrogenedentes bacterium]|nr:Rrf2 family transcriptional regulator [Candidatus Hydrogenedentota bacterium]
MLTRKAKYALKALIVLAKRETEEPVMISELAKVAGVPKKFLELILLELRNQGILQSRRGKAGGYLLNVPPHKVSLGEVVRLVDGPLAPVPCLSKTAYRRCDDCVEEGNCGVRLALREAYVASLEIMQRTTLADVLTMIQKADSDTAHGTMFYI